ncbi:L,D-transpeptidase family protein [Afipia carboxidovorans]|uniref:L,D-transpeptidase family protein n=1 Tax=Afipia carboxidovorans TaxID=40137 RepID=UPI003093BB59|nr:L,D-transpeptidase family protein [Afipia carboxidovorans]
MHDLSTGRSGYDRMLAAVAATFLLAGTVTFAHAEPASEAAISAAVPMPDTSLVPPPTAADVKLDAVKPAASTQSEASKAVEAAKPASTEPAKSESAETRTPAPAAPAAEAAKSEPAKSEASKSEAAAPAATNSDAAKAQTPATTAEPAVAALDPFGEALRDLIATKGAKYFDRKKERAAVEAFYKDRNYAPLWTKGAAASPRASEAIARLKKADEDGLDAGDYPIPDFAAATTPEAQADVELRLTESALDYARHAQSGRMHWSQVSGDIQYPDHTPDPTEILINISTARNAGAALETYNPPHKAFQQLRAKLTELRGDTDESHKIADGETLRFIKATKKNPNPAVMEDARVPALRAKLGVTENASDTHYDATVATAVRKFQAANGLKATGVLDKQTLAALNGPKNDRKIDIVRVNMERWRWLPRDLGAKALGDAYVVLNIPDYSLKLMHNGAPVWKTRVVVGKPGKHATPELTETMKYITVNPTWNVPPSIIYNEYLPALQQDPTVLERMGLKLQRNPDGTIRISQPPGERNALGRIRFNFPNKFLVYQHDTPDKHLFAKTERAFSHGCMRVQNPDQYAANLLSIALPKDHYTPEKIRGMYGRSEININFPTPIPVNIVYHTAFVDDAGVLEFRKDIYGRDARMISLLKGSGKNLEAVVAHSQPNYVKPTNNINIPGDGYADRSSGPNFFELLFGGGRSAQVEQEPRRRRQQQRY